jgi:hypothetical protein
VLCVQETIGGQFLIILIPEDLVEHPKELVAIKE